MNYTKGKWAAKQIASTNFSISANDDVFSYIQFKLPGMFRNEDNFEQKCQEAYGDINLILSAPEMFEALNSIKDDGKITAQFWKLRHKALMKIQGKR